MAPRRSPAGDLLTELVLKVFRLNGRFLEVADSLTGGSGLTAARWQVLGAILKEPLTVASIARQMGLARQSVQRLADVLVDAGMCEYLPNPAHARAKLLSPTEHGRTAIERICPGQVAWADRVAASAGKDALKSTLSTVEMILAALERSEPPVVRGRRMRGRAGARGRAHG